MFINQSIIVCVLFFSGIVSAFRVGTTRTNLFRPKMLLKMSEEKPSVEPSYSIVPVDLENMGTAAGIFTGVLGLIIAGPLGGVVLAAIGKYVSKKENDSGEALRGLGKAIIEAYNFVSKLNVKYSLTDQAGSVVTSAVSAVGVSDNEALETVKKTISTTTEKVNELNKEYDLISKGKQLVSAAVTLSDAALEKVEELNAKYDFVETAKSTATSTANTVVSKIKEQTNKE